MNVPTRIGLDFDNTIAGYNGVFPNAAKEAGLLPIEFTGRKNDVRNAIHESPDGNIAWQKLQGLAYGKLISQATMNDGVGEFLLRCRDKGSRFRSSVTRPSLAILIRIVSACMMQPANG